MRKLVVCLMAAAMLFALPSCVVVVFQPSAENKEAPFEYEIPEQFQFKSEEPEKEAPK